MTLKLALRNIRRTISDYAIYFITIVCGIAVFYAFNSIGDQQVLFDIEATARADIFDSTQEMISLVSYVMAFVLGFLIVYSNRFLIRRRKREFGTYLVLGMSPTQVAGIVLLETIIVGVVSLVVGLVCGLLLAQALTFGTAALFGTTISHYQFIFSQNALVLTLLCFALIYVIVAVFNLASVSRYRLIDLLDAQHKAEKAPVRNPWVCLVAFAASIAILAYAYSQLIEGGLREIGDEYFVRATVAMLVGSLVFFWSLSGFVVGVITRIKGVYLRGLVPFTVRQFAAKANTAWATLWVTCVMLFFAITIFSTGMGLVDVFVGNIERYTPYDASFRADTYAILPEDKLDEMGGAEEDSNPYELDDGVWQKHYDDAQAWNFSALAKMKEEMPHWDEIVEDAAESRCFNVPGSNFGEVLDAADVAWRDTEMESAGKLNVEVIPLSDYNATKALLGLGALELEDGEFALDNTLAMTQSAAEKIAASDATINVGGHDLVPSGDVEAVNLCTSALDSVGLGIIVPDSAVESMIEQGAVPYISYVNAMYRTPGEESDRAIISDLAQMLPTGDSDEWASSPWPVSVLTTQTEMRAQAGGLRLMITYLALYIGFVLLVTTAAILAIQQLTEAADSQQRYRLLSQLGCDSRMLSRSLFVQTLIYFLAPLALAISHCICAIGVLSDSLFSALGTDVQTPILMAVAFTLIIYGGYLLITYAASHHVVRSALVGRATKG